jgi:hypothetical protein
MKSNLRPNKHIWTTTTLSPATNINPNSTRGAAVGHNRADVVLARVRVVGDCRAPRRLDSTAISIFSVRADSAGRPGLLGGRDGCLDGTVPDLDPGTRDPDAPPAEKRLAALTPVVAHDGGQDTAPRMDHGGRWESVDQANVRAEDLANVGIQCVLELETPWVAVGEGSIQDRAWDCGSDGPRAEEGYAATAASLPAEEAQVGTHEPRFHRGRAGLPRWTSARNRDGTGAGPCQGQVPLPAR